MAKGTTNDSILAELTSIKNLVILALYGANYSSEEIGKAINKDSSVIRKMYSKKNIFKSKGDKNEE